MRNKLNVKVYYKDTDAEGVVYYANYLGWLEMGRMEFVEGLGVDQKELRAKKNIVFAVREVNCRYLAPAALGDELEVQTTIGSMEGATIIFEQKVVRPSDRTLVIEAKVSVFAMDLKKMKPVRIPDELKSKMP